MKQTGAIAPLFVVLSLLAVFVSHHCAISRSHAVMAPALNDGYTYIGTRISLFTPVSRGLFWQIRFDKNDLGVGTVAIYVSPLGKMTLFEVQSILDYYDQQPNP